MATLASHWSDSFWAYFLQPLLGIRWNITGFKSYTKSFVFQTDWSTNIAALASDNYSSMDFDETQQEEGTKCLLPALFLRADLSTKMAAHRHNFYFSETAEHTLTKLNSKQVFNILYFVGVVLANLLSIRLMVLGCKILAIWGPLFT